MKEGISGCRVVIIDPWLVDQCRQAGGAITGTLDCQLKLDEIDPDSVEVALIPNVWWVHWDDGQRLHLELDRMEPLLSSDLSGIIG